MSNTHCIYVLASRSRNLYTGVTNNLERRLIEHRQGLVPGFTSRYRIFATPSREKKKSKRGAVKRKSG
jgi:putative endonuclease